MTNTSFKVQKHQLNAVLKASISHFAQHLCRPNFNAFQVVPNKLLMVYVTHQKEKKMERD